MSVEEDLKLGRDYLAEHGHAKRQYLAFDGSACALGSLTAGCLLGQGRKYVDTWDVEQYISTSRITNASVYLREAMAEVVGWNEKDQDSHQTAPHIPSMNDRPSTTIDDVLASFDKAIAKAGEDGA